MHVRTRNGRCLLFGTLQFSQRLSYTPLSIWWQSILIAKIEEQCDQLFGCKSRKYKQQMLCLNFQ